MRPFLIPKKMPLIGGGKKCSDSYFVYKSNVTKKFNSSSVRFRKNLFVRFVAILAVSLLSPRSGVKYIFCGSPFSSGMYIHSCP